MPPRYAYWTILAGGLPTAFRAAEQDDLLPTFKQIKQRHPDAVMKWFARGKLWTSPDEAMEARRAPRGDQTYGQDATPARPRGRDWRPGGRHEDPRKKFIDAKKARNQDRRQQRWKRTHENPVPSADAQPPGLNRAPRPDPRPRDPQRPESPRGAATDQPWKSRPRTEGGSGTGGNGPKSWRGARPSGPKGPDNWKRGPVGSGSGTMRGPRAEASTKQGRGDRK
jgi:hypothetical protein